MDPRDSAEHEGASFQDLELPSADLADRAFESCRFEHCSLAGIDLSRTRFVDCVFESCDLSNAVVVGARLRDVAFRGCKLIGVQWVDAADCVGPSFEECNLSYGNFTGLKLVKTSFARSVARDSDFAQADLRECSFAGVDLLNARFAGTTLLKADFRGAVSYLIDPIANKVRGARFSMPEAQGLLFGLGIVID